MSIYVRGTALLSISDHISRESEFPYGVLVGTRSPTGVIARDAFILKSADTVDLEFLSKRLSLLRAVNPNWCLVGLYTSHTGESIPSAVVSEVERITSSKGLILLVPKHDHSLQCFSADTNEEVSFTTYPGESEAVAVSTVQNHPNYTEDGLDLAVDSSAKLHSSLVQLEARLTQILDRPELDAETERRLVHLAQLVMNYEGHGDSSKHELLTSHLCLLTSQMAAIDSAVAQMNSHVSNIKKTRLPLRKGYDI